MYIYSKVLPEQSCRSRQLRWQLLHPLLNNIVSKVSNSIKPLRAWMNWNTGPLLGRGVHRPTTEVTFIGSVPSTHCIHLGPAYSAQLSSGLQLPGMFYNWSTTHSVMYWAVVLASVLCMYYNRILDYVLSKYSCHVTFKSSCPDQSTSNFKLQWLSKWIMNGALSPRSGHLIESKGGALTLNLKYSISRSPYTVTRYLFFSFLVVR